MTRSGRLLLAGVSVRALAASAARSSLAAELFPGGGLAVDYFGDEDLRLLRPPRPLRVLALGRELRLPRSCASLGRAALRLRWRALAYASALENRPDLLRRLGRRGVILGSGADTVREVRDPAVLFPFLARQGIAHPRTLLRRAAAPRRGRFLFKPRRSGGGRGVRDALPGERRPAGAVLQERLEGRLFSAALLAAGGEALVLGVSEQIAGFAPLGGSGYRYGGNIAGEPPDLLPPGALGRLEDTAAALARRFALRGLAGFDFVLPPGGAPAILEVNPRYTASMELHEERTGASLFDLHLGAVLEGRLPAGRPPAVPGAPRFLAKGILYADEPCRFDADPADLAALGARDRPRRGERFGAGRPVCTLIAAGPSPAACRDRLAAAGRAARGLLTIRREADGARLWAGRGSW